MVLCKYRDQLEFAKTDDELWNAAQREMLHLGKCHGMLGLDVCCESGLQACSIMLV